MASVSILQRGAHSFRMRTRWRDPATGQTRENTTTIRGTREYAEAQKRLMLDAFANGRMEKLSAATVAGYLEGWVDHRVALGAIRLTSANTYRTMFKLFTARFGADSLVSLKPEAVRSWVTDTIIVKGQGSTRYACTILKTAFKAAVKEGLIPYNVFDRIEIPKGGSTKKDKTIPAKAVRQIWDDAATAEGLHGLAIRLAVETGMRRGELAGLRWGDISETGTVRVRRTVVVVNRKILLQEPKTKSGSRAIRVTDTLRDEINSVRGEPDVFIFSGKEEPPHPEALSRMLGAAVKGYGHFSAHDFRHAHATHLLRNGVPISAVAKRLGHARVTTTLSIYAHAVEEDEDTIVDSINNLLCHPQSGDQPPEKE